MVFYFIFFIIHSCLDTMFIMPNETEVDLFIGMERKLGGFVDAFWYIKMAKKSDIKEGEIQPIYKRKNPRLSNNPTFFKPIKSEDAPNLIRQVKKFTSEDENQMMLCDWFFKSSYILKATLEYKKEKAYYVEILKSVTPYRNVDQILTSKKIMFDGTKCFHRFEWTNLIAPFDGEVPDIYDFGNRLHSKALVETNFIFYPLINYKPYNIFHSFE